MALDRNVVSALLVAGVGYVVYKILTTSSASGTIGEQASNFLDNVKNTISPGSWAAAGNGPEYVPYINQVEAEYGIPANLLARIAYEESHFRDDIVNGQTLSSAGAVGLMQLMPQYYPNAGQNWQNDVVSAAVSLAAYYRQFGDWQLAVAAYNFGPGNVTAYLKGTKALPSETQTYVAQVFADVPIAGSLVSVNA